MGIIQYILNRQQEKLEDKNIACRSLIARIDDTLRDAKSVFAAPQVFIDPNEETLWKKRNSNIFSDCAAQNILPLKKAPLYSTLLSKRAELLKTKQEMSARIHAHNEHAADLKLQTAYSLVGNVEGRKLDRQQMTCIVKQAHNHLVIAGAGTGKTTTVIGKIKYLLKTGSCLPQDILVLSFTNASATEMSQRIAAETGEKIAASTFHKLGLQIITQVDGVMPKISRLHLRNFIKDQLALHMQSEAYLRRLSTYLLYHRVVEKSEFDFKSQEEYEEYLTLNPPTTVNNETVKSYGEMDIANFLTQNGIRYLYEHPYEVDTRTSEFVQYHPDFYLPDYQIYIEYFGINRNGEVPSYFKSTSEMSASEAYRESMEWKRATHRENHTTLVECFAYEKWEGTLLESLKEKLESKSVTLIPQSPQELWQQLERDGESSLDGLVELFETLINLIKSNGYDIAQVHRLNHSGRYQRTNAALLSLLDPIFTAYCQHLSTQGEIDFNDMINLATDYVRQGKYKNPYKYVIVDEYQDISKARFSLLNSLRNSQDFDLFCVGDDWQSIYRFAGSDIGFILNFSKYWGTTEVSKIETTYRFSQKLIAISGSFIMRNPTQVKKSIRGMSSSFGFPLGEISGYNEKFAVEFMAKKLNDLPKNSSVFFIGRYSFDVNLLHESDLFSCQYNSTSGFIDVKLKSQPNLNMVFLTAHKSKGLQADYVFIINNKKSRMGFPSKIQDAPILDLLLDNCDQYPYAEERRLFYVALTRAKKKAFLLTVSAQESAFVQELKEKYGNELKKEHFECPLCGGQLIKHSGPYGEFLGCTNYRSAGCTYKRKLHKQAQAEKHPT